MSSVLLNGIGNGGLTSLRTTRTSEVSTFVKNYNKAQSRFMRKEVDIWYKSTRHTLRSLSGNQQKLYGSLLKLSKEKKAIKVRREDESKQKKISRENYLRRKEQLNRRRLLAQQDSESSSTVNVLILDRRERKTASNKSRETRREDRMIADEAILEEDKDDSTKSSHNDSPQSHESDRKLVMDLLELSQNYISVEPVISPKEQISSPNKHSLDVLPVQSSVGADKRRSGNLLTKPMLTSHSTGAMLKVKDEEMPSPDTSKLSKRNGQYRSSFSLFLPKPHHRDDTTTNSSRELHDKTSDIPSLPLIRSADHENETIRKATDSNITPSVKLGRKRDRKERKLKMRRDPTEELNNKSSIQAMQGRTYEVSCYRRNSRGSLSEECKVMDTTVDVSRYFNFHYYRDRQTRRKMLENSKSIERKQNKRVGEFLRALDKDQEAVRVQAEMKAKQLEEERLEIKKREASISRKPPRYGLQKEDTMTPAYVRKYKRRSRSRRTSREGRKSSWHIPSLYSLYLNACSPNLPVLHNNKSEKRHRATEIMNQTDFDCSGHLVNINLGKYANRDKVALKPAVPRLMA